MRKRILALFLVFLISLGGVFSIAVESTPPSPSPNTRITKEEAKQIALDCLKKYFDIEIDEKKYQETVNLTPGYDINIGYTWQFSWNMSNNEMFTHISTDIDASTGRFVGFNRSQTYRNRQQVTIADITRDQARKLAEAAIKKINPEEFKQVKLQDYVNEIISMSRVRPRYSFIFYREINGLSYPYNYINVGINGTDGSIENYSLNWQYDLELPAPEGLLDKAKALEICKDRLSMNLSYIPVRNTLTRYIAPPEVKLVYQPNPETGMIIDAKTGDALRHNGETLANLIKRDISQEQKDKIAELKAKQPSMPGELDGDKAEAYINSIIKDFYGPGYKAGNLSYSENEASIDGTNRKVWSAEVLEDKQEAYEGRGYISIDGSTGEVINAARYVYEDLYGKEYERKITWEQAYDKAVELLMKYYPDRLSDIRTEQIYQENLYPVNGKLVPNRMIHFSFPRMANGIIYTGDSINISVDTNTGEINDLYQNWSDSVSFPKAEGIITREKAKELLFEEFDLKLNYLKYNEKVNQNEYLPKHKLVYTLQSKQNRNSSNIDAFSGKLLDYQGNEAGAAQVDFYEAIKGSPAEKELSILAFQNIIDKASFKADRDITYMELLKMLVNAKGYSPDSIIEQFELQFKNIDRQNKNYPYLVEAVRYGIIDNKPVELKLDAKVTREQMVELVIRLLKYEKLAKAKGIFVLDYKDASEINSDLQGHVAIARGLGIVDGASDMFKPKENLKMQEAALIIYRALENMRE